MLKVTNLSSGYGNTRILNNITLEVNKGEIVTIIGANGAGKTTFLMTLSGILRVMEGSIEFLGTRLDKLRPHEIVRKGLVQVPQGRQLFPEMMVSEHLDIGGWVSSDNKSNNLKEVLENVYGLFPVLKNRLGQKAGTLSGGEQQMLAVSRALLAGPKLLILDEISAGLAPIVIEHLGEVITKLRKETGLTILIVEQNAHLALDIADRGYVIQSGSLVASGTAAELIGSELVKKAYLGE